MKLIIANPYFPPFAPGGAEHSLEQMCQRFVKQGWIVHVITNCYDGSPHTEERKGYTVKFDYSPIRLSPGQQIDASEYLYSKQYFHRLIDSLIDSSYNGFSESIFIANSAQCFIALAHAGKIVNVPTIGIVRDTPVICEIGTCIDNKRAEDAIPCKGLIGAAKCMLQFYRVRGYRGVKGVPVILYNGISAGIRRNKLRRYGLRRLDRIVTISEALMCMIGKLPQMRNSKITTIPNFFTDIDRASDKEVMIFLKKNGLRVKSYFLVAGKKSYGKGSDLAVKAIEIARKKHPNIRLLFVGKGTVQSYNPISYVDNESVPQDMLLGLLYHSKALLIPGRWQEGSHRTMIDALYLGIPIICTDAGGPKEGVTESINGYVVGCDDPSQMAKVMIKLSSWGEGRLNKCRCESIKRFDEMFSEDVLMSKWRTLLMDVMLRR